MEELDDAEHCIIKEEQLESFQEKVGLIEAGKSLPQRSKLSALCPYPDESGTLRIGGRLKNIDIQERSKH